MAALVFPALSLSSSSLSFPMIDHDCRTSNRSSGWRLKLFSSDTEKKLLPSFWRPDVKEVT